MDLTEVILSAKKIVDISIEKFHSLIKIFSEESNLYIQWDKDDGEKWGGIFDTKSRVGIFSADMPLLFIDEKKYSEVICFFRNNYIDSIIIIPVQSWDRADYSINLSDVVGIIDWHSCLSSKEKISLNDLWYSTL